MHKSTCLPLFGAQTLENDSSESTGINKPPLIFSSLSATWLFWVHGPKSTTIEEERGCQIQNKFQKCRTNSFVDVRYEMKSDIRGDA